jgi:hypothetical protein
LARLKKRDIIFSVRDWLGREVILDRQTLKAHVLRYHIDAAFIVDSLKEQFARPRIVIENKKHKSENAIYDLAFGDFPCTLVAIKQGWLLQKRQILTMYGIPRDYLPKGRMLWPQK